MRKEMRRRAEPGRGGGGESGMAGRWKRMRERVGTARMHSSNTKEDISCRTADPEELIYPAARQTEIKLFVRKDIIDIPADVAVKPRVPAGPRHRPGDIQMNQYRLFSFSKINFAPARARAPRAAFTASLARVSVRRASGGRSWILKK